MGDAILMVGDSETDSSLFYKTHFLAGDPFVYFEQDGAPLLVVGSMEQGRAEKESTCEQVRTFEEFGFTEARQEAPDQKVALAVVVSRIVQDAGANVVVVGPAFPALFADHLRSDGIEVDIDTALLDAERRRKTPAEIAAIEEAQRATEQAVRHAIDVIGQADILDGALYYRGKPLTSEFVRSEIEASLLRQGMDTSHGSIVAGGPGAADPHWQGTGVLKAGEAIVLDIFPRSKRTRYFADMTRTVVKGEPSPQLRAMYETVERAQEAAFREIRAGVNGRSVHEAVKAVFREAGYEGEGSGPRYIHGTGHGLGLDIHEPHGFSVKDDILVDGEVLTVEPGLYDPEIGAVRIEDIVVVTADGYRNLTDFPKQFEV
jgi:Xaa-Pro aminopeptidase